MEHLGYVQIDTINVIERCHHHILYSRIPGYRREHLRQAQTVDKTVFEYWTHALSYLPTADMRFYVGAMKRHWQRRSTWFTSVTPADLRKVLRRIRTQGALTIRDIDDDVLVDKDHPWASRKPSKRALQLAFYRGLVTVSERDRHAQDLRADRPGISAGSGCRRPRSEREILNYLLDRALRSQGVVSLDSVCHLDARRKPAMRRLIESTGAPQGAGAGRARGGGEAGALGAAGDARRRRRAAEDLVHILSPFDPLIIQRKRLQLFFDYEHRFEAYVPKEKRLFGYFALPVLVGDEIVAAIDLKTDRERRKLLMQQWTWVGNSSPRSHKKRIEEALHRFERFQLAR